MAKFDWSKDAELDDSSAKKSFDWSKDAELDKSSKASSAFVSPNGLLDSVSDFTSDAVGQVAPALKQLLSNPLRTAANAYIGINEGSKGLWNTIPNIAAYLKQKGIGEGSLEDFLISGHAQEGMSDFQKKLLASMPQTGAPVDQQKGDALLQGAASYVPYMASPGSELTGLAGLASRAAAGGAYSLGQNENPIIGILSSLGGDALGKGIQSFGKGASAVIKGGQKLADPQTYLPSSPLTADQLRNAQQVTKGTDTSLGNVIDNPFLKEQYENVLSKLPMSGANQSMQRTAEGIKNTGTDILQSLKGDSDSSNIGQTIKTALNDARSETWAQKNAKFDAVNDQAQKVGVTSDQKNYLDTAKNELDKINSSPQLKLHADPKTVKLLNDIVDQGASEESLKNMDLLRGKLGDKANTASINGDGELATIYKNLKTASQKDIESAIDSSGNNKLKSLRDDAHDFYKKEWVPYKDPDIEKFTTKGGDSDILMSTFIKNSKNSDRANLLGKLTSKLDPQDKDLLAHSYFSKAVKDNVVNPLQMRTLYNNLGDRTKQTLLSPEMISKLNDFTGMVDRNTKPLSIMFNPQNGAQNTAQIPWKAYAAGTLVGGVPGGIIAASSATAAGKAASKALESESLRNAIIDKLIKAKEKSKSPSAITTFANTLKNLSSPDVSPVVRAMLQSVNNQNKQGQR